SRAASSTPHIRRRRSDRSNDKPAFRSTSAVGTANADPPWTMLLHPRLGFGSRRKESYGPIITPAHPITTPCIVGVRRTWFRLGLQCHCSPSQIRKRNSSFG